MTPSAQPPGVPLSDEKLRSAVIGGLSPLTGPIEIVDYDADWPNLYAREEERIRGCLGGQVIRLEHTGSTSVPGLAAKARIDMLLVVNDSADEEAYVPALERSGYFLRIREPGWYEHRVLKGPDTDVNLHVLSGGCPEIERVLAFRDWLRAHGGDRELYERTKRELAQRPWRYVQNYADAKSAVIEAIIARALANRPGEPPAENAGRSDHTGLSARTIARHVAGRSQPRRGSTVS